MASEIRVPRLGWSMEEGTFLGWKKQEGDAVKVGEILYELEGEKATQEIESLDAGILRIAPTAPAPGTVVPVGVLLGCVAAAGERVIWESIGALDPSQAAPSKPVSARAAAPAAAAARPDDAKASPRARRAARERGIEWQNLEGSGRDGRVRERDVVAAAPSAVPPAGEEFLPLTPRRRTIAERMVASLSRTAPVTLTTRADVTQLVALRNDVKSSATALVPTYTDLVAKLVATVLEQHPLLACRWEQDRIVVPKPGHVHIGIAVDAAEGLLVPVLRNPSLLALSELAAQSRDLVERARSGKLTAAELQGAVFTITNLGAYGIDAFTPIIHWPQTAILGLGTIRREPVYVDQDRIEPRQIMTLSLTFDHRVIDGGPAARFLSEVVRALEDPNSALKSQ